jgi:hypothetical protein
MLFSFKKQSMTGWLPKEMDLKIWLEWFTSDSSGFFRGH